MPRYVVRRARDDWDELGLANQRTITVHEDAAEPVATGLLDAAGVPLYRLPDRVPLGFHASKPRVRVKAGRGDRCQFDL